LQSHRRTIYIVDFGMARQYRLGDGLVRKERYYAGFRGTMRYVSVTVHERRDQGPTDDIWSLFYSLIELFQGSLPWTATTEPNDIAKFKINVKFDEFGRLITKVAQITFSEICKSRDLWEVLLKKEKRVIFAY
uniref:Protein kinase domain-containing protein n=1 Tax=Gongylonema pulchrum TaxID=637853 RepID=A0A183EE00_9BILA